MLNVTRVVARSRSPIVNVQALIANGISRGQFTTADCTFTDDDVAFAIDDSEFPIGVGEFTIGDVALPIASGNSRSPIVSFQSPM
jgi:hypothetical protein